MANTVANLLMTDVKTYLEVKSAFDECDPEIQKVVMDMIAIHNDPEADDDEKRRAAWTIVEALFPAAAVDFMETEAKYRRSGSAQQVRARMDEEENNFSQRLAAIMDAKGMTQEMLADKTGVGQPAISNMLKRACRPQKRTVARLAEALEIAPEVLWPAINN